MYRWVRRNEIDKFEQEGNLRMETQHSRKSMKRTLVLILPALAAAALFAGLVHAVLVAAHVSEPAPTTVYGMTPRRLWATTALVLAVGGVVISGLLPPHRVRAGRMT